MQESEVSSQKIKGPSRRLQPAQMIKGECFNTQERLGNDAKKRKPKLAATPYDYAVN